MQQSMRQEDKESLDQLFIDLKEFFLARGPASVSYDSRELMSEVRACYPHASKDGGLRLLERLQFYKDELRLIALRDFGGGENLLHAAISAGEYQLAMFVADAVPESLNTKDDLGYTPLLHAIARGQLQTALHIAKHPETDCAVTNNGFNALHLLAATKIPADDLRAYAKRHLHTDAEESASATVRRLSQKMLVEPLARALLAHINLSDTNRYGNTPAQIAYKNGYKGLGDLLSGKPLSTLAASMVPEEKLRWSIRFWKALDAYIPGDDASRNVFAELFREGVDRGFFEVELLRSAYAKAATGKPDAASGKSRAFHVVMAALEGYAKERGWALGKGHSSGR